MRRSTYPFHASCCPNSSVRRVGTSVADCRQQHRRVERHHAAGSLHARPVPPRQHHSLHLRPFRRGSHPRPAPRHHHRRRRRRPPRPRRPTPRRPPTRAPPAAARPAAAAARAGASQPRHHPRAGRGRGRRRVAGGEEGGHARAVARRRGGLWRGEGRGAVERGEGPGGAARGGAGRGAGRGGDGGRGLVRDGWQRGRGRAGRGAASRAQGPQHGAGASADGGPRAAAGGSGDALRHRWPAVVTVLTGFSDPKAPSRSRDRESSHPPRCPHFCRRPKSRWQWTLRVAPAHRRGASRCSTRHLFRSRGQLHSFPLVPEGAPIAVEAR